MQSALDLRLPEDTLYHKALGLGREVVMQKWGRRIRAAIGMGLTWAAAWFGAGTLLARVPGFYSDLPFALLFAPLGFVTGIIFSGVLVVSERPSQV